MTAFFRTAATLSSSKTSTPNKKIILHLYRSLLRASTPFSIPPHAKVLSSLLHRRSDVSDRELSIPTELALRSKSQQQQEQQQHQPHKREPLPKIEAMDLSMGYLELQSLHSEEDDEELWNDVDFSKLLIKKLWREVFGDDAMMRFPNQVDLGLTIRDLVKREFRDTDDALSKGYSTRTRTEAAFLALRKLNEKLAWIKESLPLDLLSKDFHRETNRLQAAKGVSPLPIYPPSSYLKPGCYLVAHPLLTGYFCRTVIILLDHNDNITSSSQSSGTYGLIINRTGGRMKNVIRPTLLPKLMTTAFGENLVQDGGPVNPSIQMLHSVSPEMEEKLKIGGDVLPTIVSEEEDDSDSSGSTRVPEESGNSNVFHKGDLIRAAQAVVDGNMNDSDFSFYVGASCWDVGQLESEIERGFWLPASGPPNMAMMGKCDRIGEDGKDDDLWLSMMCALGEEEGNLAFLLMEDDYVESSKPCDDF